MSRLMLFPGATKHESAIDNWMRRHPKSLALVAEHWFSLMRACGDDVRELLHDGQPTACIGDAAFAYVDAFSAHVNVGFYLGAHLPDPAGLLVGTGRFMRHVSLRPGERVDDERGVRNAPHGCGARQADEQLVGVNVLRAVIHDQAVAAIR